MFDVTRYFLSLLLMFLLLTPAHRGMCMTDEYIMDTDRAATVERMDEDVSGRGKHYMWLFYHT